MSVIEALPEEQRNRLLRAIDWRFLLRSQGFPGSTDPVRIGFPSRSALARARGSMTAGGELVCSWRVPRPLGAQRARRRLRTEGFTDVRLLWPGPLPHRPPQFWLPPEAPAAAAHLLAGRPAGSTLQAALRPLWRLAARLGLLAPVVALARLPSGAAEADDLSPYLPPSGPCLLLSGGRRSINKVVALPFRAGEVQPAVVVKFSRLSESDAALEREAGALEAVERQLPRLRGVPRLLARGRRGGGLGLAESAIFGQPLIDALTPASFELLAERVGDWLLGLAGKPTPVGGDWRQRLVERRLVEFERNFGAVAQPGTVAAARGQLAALAAPPAACEHRDCSPWNVVLTEAGAPALLDWESAEPRGLAGLDLAYFLANCAFVLDGALDSGRTRESYARLLDPSSPPGAIAQQCTERYCAALGLSAEDYARLRLLTWIVHSHSDHSHAEMAAEPNEAALRRSTYLGLAEEELARLPSVGGHG
ncbi:MAG TPA: hypothetical protein VG898_06515 [Solirubrobacterales bacterium]|nr:hypothetical protein [Solirubrobacterales bacterium]